MGKKVMVISSGIVHPYWWARKRFHQILYGIDDIEYVFTSSVESLKDLICARYDAVTLYFHKQKITSEALQAIDDFVNNGGGLLAIHSASASFKRYSRYFDILGGRFTSHGKVEEYTAYANYGETRIGTGISGGDAADTCDDNAVHTTVEPGDNRMCPTPDGDADSVSVDDIKNIRRIFDGIDGFQVKDELYFHEYDLKNTIHFYVEKNGKKEPVVWTRYHGKGRVCYLAPGHRAESFKNPYFQEIIRRGLRWVCRI